jgi:hypothetical protein
MNRLTIQSLSCSKLKDSIPTIKNELKLPQFNRFYPNYENRYNSLSNPQARSYTYSKLPPSLKEIIDTTVSQTKKEKGLSRDPFAEIYSNISPNKSPADKDSIAEIDKKMTKKTAAIDMALLGFEVFARSRPGLLPNPDNDPLDAIVFNLSNEKVKYSEVYENKKGK